jgi:hypothetical protein
MTLSRGRKLGPKVLGVYLVAVGAAPHLAVGGLGLVLSLLALGAGVLLLMDR